MICWYASPAFSRVVSTQCNMATSGSRLAAFRERKREEKKAELKKKTVKEDTKLEGPRRYFQAASESTFKEPAFMGLPSGSRFFNLLTAQEIRDLRTVFDAFDSKSLGTINEREMHTAMTALGFMISQQQLGEAITDLGIRNRKIQFNDFLSIVIDRQADARDTHDEIMQVFQILDKSGSGVITLDDLKQACRDSGETLTEKELSDMIYEADTDGDDAVSRAEFLQIMLKTNLFQ